MYGHMKTNRTCPLWREGIEEEEEAAEASKRRRT